MGAECSKHCTSIADMLIPSQIDAPTVPNMEPGSPRPPRSRPGWEVKHSDLVVEVEYDDEGELNDDDEKPGPDYEILPVKKIGRHFSSDIIETINPTHNLDLNPVLSPKYRRLSENTERIRGKLE